MLVSWWPAFPFHDECAPLLCDSSGVLVMIKWDSGGHMTWPYNQWVISEGGHWLIGTQDQSGLILSGPVLVLQFLEVFRTSPVLVLSKIGCRTRLDWTLKHYRPISTSVIFASHWQWLRYALHLLISSLLTYCTSLGTYCPLSSLCYSETIGPQPATLEKKSARYGMYMDMCQNVQVAIGCNQSFYKSQKGGNWQLQSSCQSEWKFATRL